MATRKKTTKKAVKQKSVEKAETKNERSSRWPLIIMILFVIAVFAVLMVQSRPDKESYNEFDFTKGADDLWYLQLDINNKPYTIVFHHHPDELEDIVVQEDIDLYVKRLDYLIKQGGVGEIYVSIDPQAPADLAIAFVEISKVTSEAFDIYNIPTHGAYTKPSSTDDHIPVKTCNDADEDTLILWIKTANTSADNVIAPVASNCVVLQGATSADTVRVADRFAYELLGVMSA